MGYLIAFGVVVGLVLGSFCFFLAAIEPDIRHRKDDGSDHQ